jgi:protein-tyrosine phosphatase
MGKILFVCKGNICRSPFAEALLRKAGYDECRSAGTENYHIGKTADVIAIEVAKEFGIDLASHVARQVQRDDIERAEHIIVNKLHLLPAARLNIAVDNGRRKFLLLKFCLKTEEGLKSTNA